MCMWCELRMNTNDALVELLESIPEGLLAQTLIALIKKRGLTSKERQFVQKVADQAQGLASLATAVVNGELEDALNNVQIE